MNRILIIAYNKLDVISGTEKYSRQLVEILNNNYKDIEIHVAIVDSKIKKLQEDQLFSNVRYHFIENDYKKSKINVINYHRERNNILKFIRNILLDKKFNIIINATYIYFKGISELKNSFLIQHNDVSLYLNTFIDKNKKLLSFFSNLYLRFVLHSRNLIKFSSNIVVFEEYSLKEFKKYSKSKFYIIPLFNKTTFNVNQISKDIIVKREKLIFLGRIYDTQKDIKSLIRINNKLDLIDFYGNLYDDNSKQFLEILKQKQWYKGYFFNDNPLYQTMNRYKFMVLYSKYEGFPFSLVESLSCGIPIIVKDNFTSAKFLCNEKTGLLLNKNNSLEQDIHEINRFYNMSNEEYLKYCNNCLDFFKKWLNYDSFEKRWKDIFNLFLN